MTNLLNSSRIICRFWNTNHNRRQSWSDDRWRRCSHL